MSQTMNRDEARIWMAQNPDREVIDARGWIWKCTESGLLAVRGEDTCWRDAVAGLMLTSTYTIFEPEKPKEDELLESMKCWDKAWMAAALRAEIVRIADERIGKAKVRHGITAQDCQIDPLITLIPGDE